MSQPLCSICLIAGSRTLIVQLEPGSYDTLELDRLEQLTAEFREVCLLSSADEVIVDLSAVQTGGSGLLTCLGRFCDALSHAGQRLVVCGDQIGLIAQVGWSQRMNLEADLNQALERVARIAA